MELDNTAALVTGAASGLGQATAQALAAKGERVFALDISPALAAAPATDGRQTR